MQLEKTDAVGIAEAIAAAEPVAPDVDGLVAELAALGPLDYDRRRKVEAGRLEVSVTALDAAVRAARPNGDADGGQGRAFEFPTVEPWPEPVEGAALVADIAGAIGRFVALPKHADVAISLWVLQTWTLDAWPVSPLLVLSSPTPRCGKTTALTVLQRLVPKPLPAANVTPAALFRSIERWTPTLLIDEADCFLRDSDEIRGLLNAGHSRAGAVLIRTIGDNHEPRAFRVWCAKAIALIGRLHPTLADRSITLEMRRRRRDETVERLRLDRDHGLGDLARRCARWAADNLDELRADDPATPGALHDRACDNWRPLLAIADRAGGDWPEKARAAALALSGGGDDADSARVMLLADLREMFADEAADALPSARIVGRLTAMEDRPWPEWRHGKPITTRQLASLLRPFGIAPTTIRIGTATPKGYRLESFCDAFARYLPPLEPQQRHNPQESRRFDTSASATPADDVADQNGQKVKQTGACGGVADETPLPGDEGDFDALDDPEPVAWGTAL